MKNNKSKFLLLAFLLVLLGASTHAATFTVNSILDTADANIGDGICNDGGGNCTLRSAIAEANFTNAADTIEFSILPFDGSVKTIAPASALPDITQTVTIDGYTQPGASLNTLITTDNAVIRIELNGAGGGVDGLRIAGSGSTVRGLAINRFARNGVTLIGASGMGDNITISGNFIGTDAAGAVDLGNGNDGVSTENGFGSGSDNNLIGGTTLAARNIISGNKGIGVSFIFCGGNTVQGNFIGLGADGGSALGNSAGGVSVSAFTAGTLVGGDDAADGTIDGIVGARNYISGNGGSGVGIGGAAFGGATIQGNYIGTNTTGTLARGNSGGIGTNIAYNSVIGGSTAGAGNLISGNVGDGISIGNTGNLIVRGNRIGTTADGVGPLGNIGDGVEIYAGGSDNRIGGIGIGDANIIAFNTEDGVQVTDVGITPANNPILSNSIFSNGGLGINLSIDGVTPNDPGDGDSGANNLQNFPIITGANSGTQMISGTLNSNASISGYAIQFYKNAGCDVSGNGEGATYIGSTSVNTDGTGNASFTFTASPSTFVAGDVITATATDLSNNTSEFSACSTALAPTPTPNPTPTPIPTPTSQVVNFVIGDLNAVVGKQVTYWGAQWAKSNSLSGGSVPSSFKGFANSASTNPASCGGTWRSGPGNSSGPPSSVPTYITVIVTSSITKSGSTFTGNIPRMVIVKTDPGYGPSPGQAGTGKVVAILCPTTTSASSVLKFPWAEDVFMVNQNPIQGAISAGLEELFGL